MWSTCVRHAFNLKGQCYIGYFIKLDYYFLYEKNVTNTSSIAL
jgi:hypothetical protein